MKSIESISQSAESYRPIRTLLAPWAQEQREKEEILAQLSKMGETGEIAGIEKQSGETRSYLVRFEDGRTLTVGVNYLKNERFIGPAKFELVFPVPDTATEAEPIEVETVKASIASLAQEAEMLQTTIQELMAVLIKEGIRPNLAIPVHGGVVVSSDPEPLGSLKTEKFALQKQVNHLRTVVDRLLSQLPPVSSK